MKAFKFHELENEVYRTVNESGKLVNVLICSYTNETGKIVRRFEFPPDTTYHGMITNIPHFITPNGERRKKLLMA